VLLINIKYELISPPTIFASELEKSLQKVLEKNLWPVDCRSLCLIRLDTRDCLYYVLYVLHERVYYVPCVVGQRVYYVHSNPFWTV
jgi:hypothetical protein